MRFTTPFGLGQNGCWLCRGSQLPRAIPLHKPFFRRDFPERPQKGSSNPFKSGRLSFLFSCSSSSSHSSPLLMSGSVYPSSGPIFPCSVWKCDLAGQVSAMLHLLQWVHLKCSVLSFSKFRTLRSYHSWSCLPCFFWKHHCDSLPGLLQLVCLQCSIWPIWTPFANAALPPHYCLQTSYPSATHFVSSPLALSPPLMFLAVSLHLLLSLPLLTPSGFFNGMLTISEPGALNYYTFFRLILLTLVVSRNPILTHLPLSGFPDSLICNPIAPTPGMAFSLLMARTVSLIFVRQGSSFSALSAFSLSSLDPYSHYVRVNICLNNFSSLSFHNVFAPPIRTSLTNGRTDSFSPSILTSSKNLFILVDFNCHHPL